MRVGSACVCVRAGVHVLGLGGWYNTLSALLLLPVPVLYGCTPHVDALRSYLFWAVGLLLDFMSNT